MVDKINNKKGRYNMKITKQKLYELIHERDTLLERKINGGLYQKEKERLQYIRHRLDCKIEEISDNIGKFAIKRYSRGFANDLMLFLEYRLRKDERTRLKDFELFESDLIKSCD
jgi:hypothetical protein